MRALKKIIRVAIFALLIFFSFDVRSQCGATFGNFPPPFSSTSSFGANYLLGTKHTLTVSSTLIGLGYQGNNTGTGMQMAIYTDNSGTAGNLVAQTSATTNGSGNITLPVVTPTVIPAGDYWIMAVYQGSNLNNTGINNSSTKTVDYISHTYGNTIPTTASWISYTGQDFNYWAVLSSTLISVTNSLCAGSAITLSSTPGTSYSWNTGATTQTIAVSPSVTTVYTVVPTGGNCTPTNVITVSVVAIPTLAVNNGTICKGSSFLITPSGGSSYTISGNNALVSPLSTTVYTVTGKAQNGCAASNTVFANVSVIVSPTPSIAGGDSLCTGSAFSMIANASGASSYSWTGPNYNAGGNSVNFNSITQANAGAYLVTAYFNSGTLTCTTAMVKIISVYQPPSILITGSNSACSNASLTLSANSSGAINYSWMGPNSFNAAGQSLTVNPVTNSGGGAYTVTTSYKYGTSTCTNSSQKNITVIAAPVISVTANTFAICKGSQATLTASGAALYVWKPYDPATMSFSLGATTAVMPTVNTTYTVTGSNSNCASTAIANVTVNSLPVVMASTTRTSLCKGEMITLNASGADTYTWTGGAAAVASPTVIVTNIIDYTVRGFNSDGCSSTANVKIKISSCTGLQEMNSLNLISIHPNPNNGQFYIDVENAANLTLEIYNTLGQQVFSRNIADSAIEVHLNNFSAGMYIVRLRTGETIFTEKKLIVQ